jgi:hypothetical protein
LPNLRQLTLSNNFSFQTDVKFNDDNKGISHWQNIGAGSVGNPLCGVLIVSLSVVILLIKRKQNK